MLKNVIRNSCLISLTSLTQLMAMESESTQVQILTAIQKAEKAQKESPELDGTIITCPSIQEIFDEVQGIDPESKEKITFHDKNFVSWTTLPLTYEKSI